MNDTSCLTRLLPLLHTANMCIEYFSDWFFPCMLDVFTVQPYAMLTTLETRHTLPGFKIQKESKTQCRFPEICPQRQSKAAVRVAYTSNSQCNLEDPSNSTR